MSAVNYYVINLEESEERLKSADAQLKKADIPYERVAAVDGRKIDLKTFGRYDEKRCLNYLGRAMQAGEVGCYLSHLKAAQQFLDSGADYGVIFEDDLLISADVKKTITELLAWLESSYDKDWGIVNLCARKLKIATALTSFDKTVLYQAHYFPMSALGLLWSRAGALAFIKNSEIIYLPVDNFLRYWFTKNKAGLSVFPPIISMAEGESDIDHASQDGTRKQIHRHPFYGFVKRRRLFKEQLIAVCSKLQGKMKSRK